MTSPAAPRRGAATRRRLERVSRRGALALLAAGATVVLLGGRGIAGAVDPAPAVPVAGGPPGAAAAVADDPAGAGGIRPAYLVVAEGDTLWDLVAPYAPSGTDPAVYAAQVAAEADLDPRRLVPGTVVRLP